MLRIRSVNRKLGTEDNVNTLLMYACEQKLGLAVLEAKQVKGIYNTISTYASPFEYELNKLSVMVQIFQE